MVSATLRLAAALGLLFTPATGLLRRKAALGVVVPEWACDAPKGGGAPPDVMNFGATVEQETQAAKSEDAKIDLRKKKALAKSSAPEEKAEYEAAREEMLELMGQLKRAKARYAMAVESMLQVPSVDGAAVTAAMEKKERDQLVVFYAPWCPHCQRFVMGDNQGIPDQAPLELLAKGLEPHKDTLAVVRFDTQANGASMPEGFEVQHIPTIYLAAADGTKTKYEGAPDPAALTAFIKEHATKTKL